MSGASFLEHVSHCVQRTQEFLTTLRRREGCPSAVAGGSPGAHRQNAVTAIGSGEG